MVSLLKNNTNVSESVNVLMWSAGATNCLYVLFNSVMHVTDAPNDDINWFIYNFKLCMSQWHLQVNLQYVLCSERKCLFEISEEWFRYYYVIPVGYDWTVSTDEQETQGKKCSFVVCVLLPWEEGDKYVPKVCRNLRHLCKSSGMQWSGGIQQK